MGESGERKLRPFIPIAAASTPISGGSALAHLGTHFAKDAFSPGHVLIWINKTALGLSSTLNRLNAPIERVPPYSGLIEVGVPGFRTQWWCSLLFPEAA
jgi:hypothetical protein